MRALALLLILTACAAPDARSGDGAADLQRELAGRTAGEPRNCIPAGSQQSLTIVDSRTLTYQQGRTLWVNRMESECPGLRPSDTLIVEVHGSQYCRGDHVRARSVTGGGIPGPVCVLGNFTPYRLPR